MPIRDPSGRAGPDQHKTRRSIQINRGTVSTYAPMRAHAIERFHLGAPRNAVWSTSPAGGRRIRTCMGLLLSSSCFWFIASSLFGAGKSFLVPSPATRFAERAEGVKGPKTVAKLGGLPPSEYSGPRGFVYAGRSSEIPGGSRGCERVACGRIAEDV